VQLDIVKVQPQNVHTAWVTTAMITSPSMIGSDLPAHPHGV
jgi:hypothetical protein